MVDTFGKYLINEQLPKGYKITSEVNKKDLKKSMNLLARDNPSEYVNVVTGLKRIGDDIATQEGLSIGLDDITPQYKSRDKTLANIKRRYNNATTDARKKKAVIEAQDALLKDVSNHPGTLTLQVKSGARGNPVQYANMVSGVGYARDAKGDVLPWMIERSYSEGLTPADYYATTNQSMMDVVKTYTAISEPGELSKKLINVMNDAVVTETDCGTQNGIFIDATSPDAVDRYTAKNQNNVPRNTLVTPVNQGRIAKVSEKILLRSPMTCEASDGVCQHCQGLDERGNIHTKGVNVGVRAAQAMSEPLTQFALNAKHGGRTLKSDKNQVHGISGFRKIIETPRQFINKATLASVPGKVTKIMDAPQGGKQVIVDKIEHYVPPELNVTVSKGTLVDQGDVLSEGIPKPDEVVRYKGLGAGRIYMVNTLQNLYKGQGKDLDSRHFELLAKSNMNHVRIMEDPSHRFIKGDIITYNNLRSALSKDSKTVPLSESLGSTLGKAYLEFSAGQRITENVIRELRKHKIKEVLVSPRAPSVEFVMKSATSVPKMHPDWLARMAHQGLKRSVLQAAHTGEVSKIHGTHPVPAYVHGVTFGQGEEGRY